VTPSRRRPPPGLRPTPPADLHRSLAVHVAWSAVVLVAAAALIAIDLSAACPPGGPIDFGDCGQVRPFAIGVIATAALLYVVGLSAVLWWVSGLLRRRVADEKAARDWYLLAAGIGLVVAPLLAFTMVSALR
jgi:hypothetical protein